MHLTVGYLATPTGDDGVALAGALARTFDADRRRGARRPRRSCPTAIPAAAEYQEVLVERGEEWIAKAVAALAAGGVTANSDRAGRRVLRRVADRTSPRSMIPT